MWGDVIPRTRHNGVVVEQHLPRNSLKVFGKSRTPIAVGWINNMCTVGSSSSKRIVCYNDRPCSSATTHLLVVLGTVQAAATEEEERNQSHQHQHKQHHKSSISGHL
jgi:hypothetical protein